MVSEQKRKIYALIRYDIAVPRCKGNVSQANKRPCACRWLAEGGNVIVTLNFEMRRGGVRPVRVSPRAVAIWAEMRHSQCVAFIEDQSKRCDWRRSGIANHRHA